MHKTLRESIFGRHGNILDVITFSVITGPKIWQFFILDIGNRNLVERAIFEWLVLISTQTINQPQSGVKNDDF